MLHNADTIVTTRRPGEILGAFEQHITEDHGMTLKEAGDGTRFIEHEAFRVDFKVLETGLYIRIAGPNEGSLIFFKEEIAYHVGELDEAAASLIRWSGETANAGDHPANFHVLTAVSSNEIFDGMQRVTLRVPDKRLFAEEGIHVRAMLPVDPDRRPVWPVMAENGSPRWPTGEDKLHARFVTLKNVRPDAMEVDIDIVRHGHGLISLWAQNVAPGSQIGIMGPAGMSALPKAQSYFLAADGTGLPAIARLLDRMGPDATGNMVIAAPETCDLKTYLPQSALTLHRVQPEDFEKRIVDLVKDLTTPGRTDYAFFAGEFQNAQDLRKHFKAVLGLDKTGQLSTAYWRRGMPGFGS